MATTSQTGGSPNKASRSTAATRLTNIEIPAMPTGVPSLGSPGSYPTLSPTSPLYRNDLSPGPGTPGSVPGSPSLAGPAVYQGDFSTDQKYVAIKDENTMSAFEYAMYKNQALNFNMMSRMTAAIETMASTSKYTAASGPKVGNYTEEEAQIADEIMTTYKRLIGDVIQKYGEDLKPTKLTATAGEPMYKYDGATEGDVEGTPGVKGMQKLFDGLSKTAVNIFYQNVVKAAIPNGPKKKPAKTPAKKTAAAATDSAAAAAPSPAGTDPNAESTVDDGDSSIIAIVMTEPMRSILIDQFNIFLKDTLAGEAPSGAKAKGGKQARDFTKAVVDMSASLADESEAGDKTVELGTELKNLGVDGKLSLWKDLMAATNTAPKPGRKGNKRTGGGDDGDDDEGGSPTKKHRGTGR
ncbi:hypothetical protein TI39_contig4468g00002 [Zymoseptoria brevis]|uniref:Uncharacterized protein n=1 Tax=Zymoseptoria brevis TaxID=1047168 RepID=A0A0F4G6P9_9PEZI|nr:hypothetical protein TI39_contig4468g00002 [Zymoseptoria brevis]